MFKALLVGLLALGFVFSGAVTVFAAQTGNPDASPAIIEPGTESENAHTFANQYANDFSYANQYANDFSYTFVNKGEQKGPFLNRFAQMFERAMGWELNDLPENANVDARTPDRTRLFTGEKYPVTTGLRAMRK